MQQGASTPSPVQPIVRLRRRPHQQEHRDRTAPPAEEEEKHGEDFHAEVGDSATSPHPHVLRVSGAPKARFLAATAAIDRLLAAFPQVHLPADPVLRPDV